MRPKRITASLAALRRQATSRGELLLELTRLPLREIKYRYPDG